MNEWFLTFHLKETKFKKQGKTKIQKKTKEKQKRGALIMIMSV